MLRASVADDADKSKTKGAHKSKQSDTSQNDSNSSSSDNLNKGKKDEHSKSDSKAGGTDEMTGGNKKGKKTDETDENDEDDGNSQDFDQKNQNTDEPKNLLDMPFLDALKVILGTNNKNEVQEGSFLSRLFSSSKKSTVASKIRPLPSISSFATWAADFDPKGAVIEAHGVRQWTLVARDVFDWNVMGWSTDQRSVCAGISMLGGYKKFSTGKLTKTFKNLPRDHEEIKLVATMHFIDQWAGESALVRMENSLDQSMFAVFTARHTEVGTSKTGINLCGGTTPEGKFTVPVDVFIPHRGESIKVEFSTTLDESVKSDVASFGISNVELYVR